MHDDWLISAALASLYDELVLEGVLRTGRGKALVIKGRDPWDEMGFGGDTFRLKRFWEQTARSRNHQSTNELQACAHLPHPAQPDLARQIHRARAAVY